MSEILQSNIFFFVTGIAVIILTFLLSIALYHFIRILKAVRRIVDRVEAGTETIGEDIERFRTYIVEESFLSRFFRGGFSQKETSEPRTRRAAPKMAKNERKPKTELRIKNEE